MRYPGRCAGPHQAVLGDRARHVAVRLARVGLRARVRRARGGRDRREGQRRWGSPCSTRRRSTASAAASASWAGRCATRAARTTSSSRRRCSRCCPPRRSSQQRGVASAHRLGVRTIDLYQVHQPNPLVGDATTMRGMRALRDVGLVDDVGVSNYRLARWQRAEAALGAPVLSNQVQFSLVARGPMTDLLPWAQRTGHLVIAYSPLGPGPAVGPLQRGATGRRAASGRPTRCSCPRTSTRPPRCCRCCARSARATASPPRRRRWPGSCTSRTSSRSPARRASPRWRATPPRPTWPSPTTSSPR